MAVNTCCFTGHRNLTYEEITIIKTQLAIEIEKLIQSGVQFFGSGGALGFDTLAAQCVLSLKQKYPNIKLILVLPCHGQTKGWNNSDIEIYNYILSNADKIVYTSSNYYPGCMLKRNRHLVDNSQVCISYFKQNTGGTAYTVKYAQKLGVPVINIAQ